MKLYKKIVRCAFLLIIFLFFLSTVSSTACDCNPGESENRICLYTDPSNIDINSATFDFDIGLRNFFRTSSGAYIKDITTSVKSCTGPGGSCSWTSSNAYFSVSINPTVISRSVAGDYGECGTSASACRSCTTGRFHKIDVSVTILNAAPDGSYTLVFQVQYGNSESSSIKSRDIEVDFSFDSNGGCTPNCYNKDCGSDGCGGSCGSCGSHSYCSSYSCVCSSGYANCNGQQSDGCETNINTDENNCGSCGVKCSSNEICQNGQCSCAPNCYNRNCGSDGCSGSCGSCGSHSYCSSYSCVCSLGYANCNGQQSDGCEVNTNTDENNCGSCGIKCSSNEICQNGQCSCAPNCYNRNCGSDGCGGSCGSCDYHSYCSSYKCVCNYGYANCNAQSSDGCEVNTNTDENNCGSCGVKCSSNEICQNGQCSCTPNCAGKECGDDGCGGNCNSCSITKPYCVSNNCVECILPIHCDDSNDCTTDACSSNTCSFTGKSDGTSCSGNGHCCNGECDTSTGNTYYGVDCRTYPSCVGSSWEYSYANNGGICENSECRECYNGNCNYDDDTRCSNNWVCTSGTCTATGCTSDSECAGSATYCDVNTGDCVGCLQDSHCNDNDDCTTDTCSSTNTCNFVEKDDGESCEGNGHCCSGECDTGLGNDGYDEECRSGPSCVSTGWEYSYANNGGICENSECRECYNGYCNLDDDTRCDSDKLCTSGVCTLTGCSSDTECTGSTTYCKTSTGDCVGCLQDSHCNDNDDCTTDTCSSTNTCNFVEKDDGESCEGNGHCCSGECDTGLGNDGYDVDCRTDPSCVGSSWKYSYANNGGICENSECRECDNGYCNYDDDTRCSNDWVCTSGTCTLTGCSSNSECTGSTPYCDISTGDCVECLQNNHCNDDNDCTTDTCSSNTCSYTDESDGTSCSGNGHCCSGECDTGLGNDGYDVDCRTDPSCVGSSWEYSYANNGEICEDSECRECYNGYCNLDDDTRCDSNKVCTSGVCTLTGCTSDTECTGSTLYCDISTGKCVQCLQASHCSGNELCENNFCKSVGCTPQWECDDWGGCMSDDIMTRFCRDRNQCGSSTGKPQTKMTCPYTQKTDEGTDLQSSTKTPSKSDLSAKKPILNDTEVPEEPYPSYPSKGKKIILLLVSFIAVIIIVFFLYWIRKKNIIYKGGKLTKKHDQSTLEGKVVSGYIRRCLAINYPTDKIRTDLLNAGWSPEIINRQLKRFDKL